MNLPEYGLSLLEELLEKAPSPEIKEKLALVKRAYQTLYEGYTRDYLTGLYNRRSFEEALSASIERSKREQAPFTLLLLDLDHFKRLNDTYGHVFGDQVLKAVAQTIKNGLRKLDFPARYGGEEFAVILPGTGGYGGLKVAKRLKQAIEDLIFQTPNGKVKASVSIGGATFRPFYRMTPKEFLKEVDKLLYQAKEAGRSTIVFKSTLEPFTEGLTTEEKTLLFGKR
ncbi:GGDEF domain-containing protein [Thermosulfurimonas dismutans]|uniref:diguanylate cyclase n=1 Tax=Thermosulfurimonas dismutans TaxID=999894 RepID=A0A179D2H7_9BACT|nr:GGDEF domain-containing protein [Thermosulfurimonas dismutans]OAQ20183.1 hypothetical protein TDIS_1685 [Thermosulfurimonas dismutans]